MKLSFLLLTLCFTAFAAPKNVVNLEGLGQKMNEDMASSHEERDVHILNSEGAQGEGIEQVRFRFDESDVHSNVLESILPQLPSIKVFAGYIRDNKDIAASTADKNANLIIIAPTDNSLATKLDGLKPWEFPEKCTDGVSQEEVIRKNLLNFVSGHVVPDLTQVTSAHCSGFIARLLNGKEIKVNQMHNDKIEIFFEGKPITVENAKRVDNGYLFVIDDVLVKP